MIKPMPNRRTTIYIPPDDFQFLKDWADRENRSVPNLINIFIKEAVAAKKEGRR